MSDGNEEDELRGCRGIVLGLALGLVTWLLIIGGVYLWAS